MAVAADLTAARCPVCGNAAAGNFCSGCGASLQDGDGIKGLVGGIRHSVPAVYLRLLRSPVKGSVALAEDPTYRSHFSFLLAGLALFTALFIPILLSSQQFQSVGPTSEAFQTWLKILSQVGVYVGTMISFALAFVLFRTFSRQPGRLHAYFKLFCIALGFMQPIYGIFEWLARAAAAAPSLAPLMSQQWEGLTPYAIASLLMALMIYSYGIAIHRRFWRMSLWLAAPLYIAASVGAYYGGYHLMWYVGFFSTRWLVGAGLLQVQP